ncbi:MAG: hypothetical protein NVS4B8_23270 [Herpetosiphon sp.]
MKLSTFTEAQIIQILQEAERGETTTLKPRLTAGTEVPQLGGFFPVRRSPKELRPQGCHVSYRLARPGRV